MTEAFYIEQKQLDQARELEQSFLETVSALEYEYTKAMGVDSKPDLVKLVNNPAEYIAGEYWEKFAKQRFPEHITPNKENILENDTGVTKANLDSLHGSYIILKGVLRSNTPKITSKEVKSTINPDHFIKDIDPDKKVLYKRAIEFEKAFNNLVDEMPEGLSVPMLLGSKFQGLFEMSMQDFRWHVQKLNFI